MRRLRPRLIFILTCALGLGLLLWPARSMRSDNFVFYLPGARQVLPLEDIEHAKYLPLLQVLNLVGKVTGLQEKRNTLKVWFGNTVVELRQDEKQARMKNLSISLPDPIRVSHGQWMVPVPFLTAVLPQLTRQPIEYQVGTNRVFIGDVKPSSFTVRLDKISNGARLTLQFTDKVTVRTVAMNGKWVLFLGDRPVEPIEQKFRFQDRYVSELEFDDQDGVPKLVLTPVTAGFNFYPALAEGGKILVADVLKPPPVAAEQPGIPTGPTTAGTSTSSVPPPSIAGTEETPGAPLAGPPRPVVVIDAGHGGEDKGARSRDGVLEKDLVAQLAGRVRLALLSSQKYRVVLTRVGDTNPTFDQRDTTANLARPVAFLTFHAGNFGSTTPRVRIYTYHSPSAPLDPPVKHAPQLFISWSRAQQNKLEQSRQLAQALQQKLAQIPGVSADDPAASPVRALRSVSAAAVAVEIGSLSAETDAAPLTSPAFLQQVSTAIAQALEGFRGGAS